MKIESCKHIHDESSVSQMEERLLSDRQIARLYELYKALGDPTRIKIISALAVRELCVHEIVQLIGVSQSAISHQLRVLRSVGLVTYRKEGRHVIYKLDDEHVQAIFDYGLEHINHQTQ